MNRPGLRTMLLGSRFTGPVIIAVCAYVAFAWWTGGGHRIIGLIALGLAVASLRAIATCAAYRKWSKDWEGMSPQAKAGKPRNTVMPSVVASVAIPALLTYAHQSSAPALLQSSLTPLTLAGGLLAWLLIVFRLLWVLRPKAEKGRQQPTPLVTIAVKRPALPAPDLRGAYQRLPAYCQTLLKGSAQ